MSTVAVLNTDAGLTGKTLDLLESDQTITGNKTFDRDPSAPFAVSANSAVVTNLDADKVDGLHSSDFARIATASVWTAIQQFPAGTVGAPGVGVGDSDVGLYSSGTNALDVATNGIKALGIDSTQFIDSPTQPRCVAYNNAVQSIAGTTPAAITFNSEDIDVGSMHDTGSNTSRITIPTGGDGFYMVHGQGFWAGNGTSYRLTSIKKNGTTTLQSVYVDPQSSDATGVTGAVTWFGNLVATDYVELMAAQNSGGALNFGAATRDQGASLSVVKLW